jgi:hypothetical protein
MGIRAVGAMRRAKLMIGGRILALAIQFTLARDAAAQLATDQPRLQREQQCESASALCASHMVVAETAGNLQQVVGLCESPGEPGWFYRVVEHSLPDGASDQSSRPPAHAPQQMHRNKVTFIRSLCRRAQGTTRGFSVL